MSGQKVCRFFVGYLLIALRILLAYDIEGHAGLFDRIQETVGTVSYRLHGRGIQYQDIAAFRDLLGKIFAAYITCVVVIRACIGYQVAHIAYFGIEAEHWDLSLFQHIQCRDNAVRVYRVHEHQFNASGDHILDLVNLSVGIVCRVHGNQGVAVALNNFSDRPFQSYEEWVGTIHAGIAKGSSTLGCCRIVSLCGVFCRSCFFRLSSLFCRCLLGRSRVSCCVFGAAAASGCHCCNHRYAQKHAQDFSFHVFFLPFLV